ncbi:MAG TPA: Crp/Fnr family transcriptional regulator [Actinomycetota bacterium]|nr:Crp/Fnr family transcriptional regulator [Actinomycetota bacterium]
MNPVEDRVAILLSTYLFEGLPPAALEPLARSSSIRRVVRGEYVFHVGDHADILYVVASGQVKDSIVTEDGDEIVHSFFGPGMVIGEPGFFSAERNRVMALVAVEPSTVLLLDREHLLPFLQRHPDVTTRALEGLASIARSQTELITALARRSLHDRLVLRLLDLAETNTERPDGAAVTPRISQSTLASMVGVSRENVNRAIGALVASGSVRREAGRYVLVDPATLRREVSSGWPPLVRRNRRSDRLARPAT